MILLIGITSQTVIAGSIHFSSATCATVHNSICFLQYIFKSICIIQPLHVSCSAWSPIVQDNCKASASSRLIIKILQTTCQVFFFYAKIRTRPFHYSIQYRKRLVKFINLWLNKSYLYNICLKPIT